MTVLELKELLHDYPDNYIIGYRDSELGDFIEIEKLNIELEYYINYSGENKEVVVVI